MATKKPTKIACPHCGRLVTPGPMKNHIKACPENPKRKKHNTVVQPRAKCRYCGKETTKGALRVHEEACPELPKGTRAKHRRKRPTCPYCGKRSTPGPLAGHIKACPDRPTKAKKTRVKT